MVVNSLPNDKILDMTKLKAFADDKLTFPKRQILDSSKLKEFADNNFKFDENAKEFSKRVKTLEKGEIACYYSVFQKTCNADT